MLTVRPHVARTILEPQYLNRISIVIRLFGIDIWILVQEYVECRVVDTLAFLFCGSNCIVLDIDFIWWSNSKCRTAMRPRWGLDAHQARLTRSRPSLESRPTGDPVKLAGLMAVLYGSQVLGKLQGFPREFPMGPAGLDDRVCTQRRRKGTRIAIEGGPTRLYNIVRDEPVEPAT